MDNNNGDLDLPVNLQSVDAVDFYGKKISRRSILRLGLSSSLLLSPLTVYAASAGGSSEQSSKRISGDRSQVPTDEDGYRAWLRYDVIDDRISLAGYREQISGLLFDGHSETFDVVQKELQTGLSGLLGNKLPIVQTISSGTVIVATRWSPLIGKAISEADINAVGDEGYIIRSCSIDGHKVIVIASIKPIGTLYGAFNLLRSIQTLQPINNLSISNKPKNLLRILAHGDNLDGSIDRGFSGRSLWNWEQLPDKVNERLLDYGRLNASIGINGVVLNKVDADPAILQKENLRKVASLAKVFRPYGLKVYVCANFAAPARLGGLATSDPLDKDVINWWHDKANEIYELTPDFGGFLVKANSEGLPGPQDFGRTHVDGANMLARAVGPHGGIIMWRAFVYTTTNQDQDRVKRSFLEFKPLDGKFDDNVLVQVKNGPLDFQPREPFHPLFGAMPKTRLVGELQINQEYLGQSTHLVYLATMWKEFLDSNTYLNGKNCSVSEVIDSHPRVCDGGFSATSNLGTDRNWCGHHFGAANWFAYGRLTWDPDLSAESIAADWIKMTWSRSPEVSARIMRMLMESHEAYVSYTMPLGLHHMVGGDHYAPLPEGEGDPRGIYHHASTNGIGYDRTRSTGSDAVDEYNPPLNDIFNDTKTCPEKFLLWFHHLPWDYKMRSGRTLWAELCFTYANGVKVAREMESEWTALSSAVDSRRHREVAERLRTQAEDAEHWSKKCLTYFSQYSKMPVV